MAEYIDREALLFEHEEKCVGECGCCQRYDTSQYRRYWCGIIKNAPAVDVVEVVHGRWISLTDCSNAGVYCSVCHKKVWKEDYAWCNRKNRLRSNYCPHCGAKMDGERKTR